MSQRNQYVSEVFSNVWTQDGKMKFRPANSSFFALLKFIPFSRVAALILCAAGCRSEVPKPTSSPAVSPPAAMTVPSAATLDQPVTAETPFELEPDFALLTRDLFDSFGTEEDTWTSTDDVIHCTGKPRGYLYSKQSYKNFTLRLEYRFVRPPTLKDETKFKGNTGFLVYIIGEHKLWPSCIEIQGKSVQIAAIKENGDAPPVKTEDNDEARQKARKPVGQWNALEIVSKEGALSASLNGTPISSSSPGPLLEGLIGIQAEDHPFDVRRMRIRSE